MLVSMFEFIGVMEFIGKNICSAGLTDPVKDDLDEDRTSISIDPDDCRLDREKSCDVGV